MGTSKHVVDRRDLDGTWDYTTLPASIVLGEGCFLESKKSFKRYFATADPGLVIGNDVRVYGGTGFGIEPSGMMTVGDRCILVGADFMCAERISIGSDVFISYGVTISDADFHPVDPVERRADAIANAPGRDRAARRPYPSAPIVIEDGVRVGIGAMILKGVSIGTGATVGPGAVVTRDVPADATVIGNPARPEVR